MFWRVLMVSAFFVGTLGLSGCSGPPKIVPKGEVSVPVHTGAGRPEAKIRLYNLVKIHLPPIAAPGNVWVVILNDARYFEQRAPIEMASDGSATAIFWAIKLGRRPIRFFALPQGRVAIPTQAYEITLTVE